MSSNGVVKYEANKPVRSRGTLKALLQQQQQSLADVAPRHLDAGKLVKLFLLAANKNPKILQCTQESVLQSVMTAAELGLDISGTTGEAYLVPYGQQLQLIIGYKGLAKLARQTGEVKRIEAEVVHEHDDFDYRKGTEFVLNFRPNLTGDRGKPVGAYALIEFKDGGIQAEWMSADEIAEVQAVSKAGRSGPWKDWAGEMWKKTVWRRLSKWVPLSSERYQKAVEFSDREFDLKATISDPDTDELNDRLGLTEPEEEVPDTLFEDDD